MPRMPAPIMTAGGVSGASNTTGIGAMIRPARPAVAGGTSSDSSGDEDEMEAGAVG